MGVPFRRACAAIAVLACLAAGPTPHVGTVDTFLQVPTITGGVAAPGFQGWIELQSYDFSESAASPGLGVIHKPSTSTLTFVKAVDKTSPLFATAYFKSTVLTGSTKLDIVTPGSGQKSPTKMQIEFHNAVVVSDSGAAQSGSALTETIQLSFDAINICWIKGNVCTAWDFANNTNTYPGK